MAKIDTNRSLKRILAAGYASMFLVVGAGGAWAVMSSLNGAIIAPATIMAESYSKRVQHKDGGIVKEILVRDGDRVEAGQPLVILDNTETKAELGIMSALLDEALAKRARLEAQRDKLGNIEYPQELMERANEPDLAAIIGGQNKLFTARLEAVTGKKNQLKQQIDQLSEQISGLDSQKKSKEKQLALISSEVKDLRDLAKKGLVPTSRVMSMDRESARLDGERGELQASRASAEAKIAEVKVQMLQIDEEDLAQTLTDLRDVEGKIAELRERRVSSAARLDRMVIKAPITGSVYQSTIHTVGGVIAPGEAIMNVVPEADDLVLMAQVRPQDIDEVRAGQPARIRFPAFNARTTPELTGEVTQVSADVSRPDQNSQPFYTVRLTLSASEVAKLQNNKLKPGMPAEAFIQTGSRSPLSYFLRPLTDQFAHALREG
jgi:HlyD family secretion protein